MDRGFGLRPCDRARARIVGRTLVVFNGKNSNHRAPGLARRSPLERLPVGLMLGIAQLIGTIRMLMKSLDRGMRYTISLRSGLRGSVAGWVWCEFLFIYPDSLKSR